MHNQHAVWMFDGRESLALGLGNHARVQTSPQKMAAINGCEDQQKKRIGHHKKLK